MKGKELKVVEPIIKNYQRDAYPLLAMGAKGEEYLPWAYSNFVQLMVNLNEFQNENRFRVMYCNQYVGFQSPFLETMKIKRSYFKLFGSDICNFIIQNINYGFYVMLSIDKYYIPNTPTYNKKHKYHDILIYGYDSNELKTLGYGRKGILEKNCVSHTCFRAAFDNLQIDKNWWNDLMFMFRCKEKINYKFNLELFKHLLWDYLNGKNTAEYTQEELAQTHMDIFAFGMDIYQFYEIYLRALVQGKGYYDCIPIHLLVEHKNIIWKSIEYLEHQNIISQDANIANMYWEKVKQRFELFLRLFIKSKLTNDVRYLKTILREMGEVVQKEKRILGNLYKLLNDQMDSFQEW